MAGDATAPQSTGQISGSIQTSPPKVRFNTDNVPPSQYLYLQLNDILALRALSNVIQAKVNVKYRFLTPEGEIKEGAGTFNVGQTITFLQIPFIEGWLLSFSLQSSGISPGGWIFAQLGIARGNFSSATPIFMGTIWEGYVPLNATVGWPGTPSQHIGDGAGTIRQIVGTAPAAGVDIAEVVPSFARWILESFQFTLTTSAVVANRQVRIKINDGSGNTEFFSPCFINQPASTTFNYSLAQNPTTAAPLTNDVNIAAPLPISLGNFAQLRTITTNLQAGDQWQAPNYLVLEWGNWDNS